MALVTVCKDGEWIIESQDDCESWRVDGAAYSYDDDDDEIAYFTVRWKTRELVNILSTASKTRDNTDKDSKNRKQSHYADLNPSFCSPLSPSITPSLFHSKLKTYLFGKSFPP